MASEKLGRVLRWVEKCAAMDLAEVMGWFSF